jgi:hypothetical protein
VESLLGDTYITSVFGGGGGGPGQFCDVAKVAIIHRKI